MWWLCPVVTQFWEKIFIEIENIIHQNIYATPALALLTIWGWGTKWKSDFQGTNHVYVDASQQNF